MRRLLLLMLIGVAAYLASGLYFVQPDELAVVRRFGRREATLRPPGAHFGLPWGMDVVDRVKPREIKRVSVGPVRVAGEAVGASPVQLLTGDRNLVNLRATIQYSIADAPRYLFQTATVDELVSDAGEAALNDVLARQAVDFALTEGKQELAVTARDRLQAIVDLYQLGVTIRSVDIAAVDPPPEVAEAFNDVVSALRERQQQINQAESYSRQTLAQAQADAQRTLDVASSHRDRVTRAAEGEADRFEKLLAQYVQSPDLTAQRLYLEAMADTLPRFRSKLIVDSGSELDLSIIREEQR